MPKTRDRALPLMVCLDSATRSQLDFLADLHRIETGLASTQISVYVRSLIHREYKRKKNQKKEQYPY